MAYLALPILAIFFFGNGISGSSNIGNLFLFISAWKLERALLQNEEPCQV